MPQRAIQRQTRAPIARSLLPTRWMFVSHIAWALAAGFVGFLTLSDRSSLSLLWIVHGVMFIDLAMAMDDDPRRNRTTVIATSVATFTAFVVGGLLAGAALPELLWYGATNLLVAWTAIAFYRFRGIGQSWVPRDARETLWQTLSLFAAAFVGLVVGAFPGTGLHPGMDWQEAIWAGARGYAIITIAVNCVTPLYFSNADRLPSRRRAVKVAIALPLAAACLVLPPLLEEPLLSWLYVIPALWSSLVMTRRSTAVYTLIYSVAGTFAPYVALPLPPLGGLVLPQAMVDGTFAFATHLAMLIIALRNENNRLQREVEDLADADRAQSELLTSVIQSMTDGMILTDRSGRVSMTNRAAESLAVEGIPDQLDVEWATAFEMDHDDARAMDTTQFGPHAVGLHSLDLQAVDLQAQDVARVIREVLLKALLQPEPDRVRQVELLLPLETDTKRLAIFSKDLPAGPERLTLIMFKDVTQARLRQQELESFAGTVAHDLKGPLTALTGWMETASDEIADDDPVAGRMALSRAHDAVTRMQNLIDDYLAYAVSRGGVLELVDVALVDVVREITTLYAHAEDGPMFELDVPHVLRADASLTRQLMANIIGNGIKYSRQGERPFIRVRSVDDQPGWAEVQVADRGRGLQPGDEERVFGRLNRSEKDAASVHGIGLGLALCHAIVTRHGGTIHAENNEWGGATFRFTLPAVELAGR